jgi:hypothetical protein
MRVTTRETSQIIASSTGLVAGFQIGTLELEDDDVYRHNYE